MDLTVYCFLGLCMLYGPDSVLFSWCMYVIWTWQCIVCLVYVCCGICYAYMLMYVSQDNRLLYTFHSRHSSIHQTVNTTYLTHSMPHTSMIYTFHTPYIYDLHIPYSIHIYNPHFPYIYIPHIAYPICLNLMHFTPHLSPHIPCPIIHQYSKHPTHSIPPCVYIPHI